MVKGQFVVRINKEILSNQEEVGSSIGNIMLTLRTRHQHRVAIWQHLDIRLIGELQPHSLR